MLTHDFVGFVKFDISISHTISHIFALTQSHTISYNITQYMLDYYGSVIKQQSEIDSELVAYFQRDDPSMSDTYLRETIARLRATSTIKPEYSVTGWYMYGGQEAILQIRKQLAKDHATCEKKLAWMYVMNQTLDTPLCMDVYVDIGEKYIH